MGECQRSRSVGRELDGFAMVTKVGPNKILQGWNMTFSFPIILGILYFQLTNSYFSDGFKPPTSFTLLQVYVD
jgi:hypothetical protein